MRTMTRAAAVLAFLAVAACGKSGSPSPSTGPTPTPLTRAEALSPGVEITYPVKGADPQPPGTVLVALTVRSFSLVDKAGGKPKEGEGHLVYYLDVKKIPTKAGSSALKTASGKAVASAETSHQWADVKAGGHTLGVQLVNHDDTPLDPPVTDGVDVIVASS